MIQEQIAEYLGVKSFKRKYPDLMRRPVDMEERNYIMERGLASEKMCDLGLTAVYASEILDIVCNDYPEKYEEYKRYQREKHYRDRQKYLQKSSAATAVSIDGPDRSQMLKDKAIQSAARWNVSMNKELVAILIKLMLGWYINDNVLLLVGRKPAGLVWISKRTWCIYPVCNGYKPTQPARKSTIRLHWCQVNSRNTIVRTHRKSWRKYRQVVSIFNYGIFLTNSTL